jgi:hypothetical protein
MADGTDISHILAKRNNDAPFWRFVDDFAATVRFSTRSADPDAIVPLLTECDRQFDYLQEHHPDYFAELVAGDKKTVGVLGVIGALYHAGAFPAHHFAGVDTGVGSLIGLSIHVAAQKEASETQAAGIASQPHPAVELGMEGMIARAREHYASMLGRVIKVWTYFIDGDDYHSGSISRDVEPGVPTPDPYELVRIVETNSEDIGMDETDVAASSWLVRVMSGPHRGMLGSIMAPNIMPDGRLSGGWACLVEEDGKQVHEPLFDHDLEYLADRDLDEVEGHQIAISHAAAFVGDTDKQVQLDFDPPLVGTVEPALDRAANIRLDTFGRERAVDVYWDFTSDDPRLDGYRAPYTHGTAYLSSGKVEEKEANRDMVPMGESAIAPGLSEVQMITRAQDHYAIMFGKVLRIRAFMIGADRHEFGSIAEGDAHYDLARVVLTHRQDIGYLEDGMALSRWSVELMSGTHRGGRAEIEAPAITATGEMIERDTFLVADRDGVLRHQLLSTSDLAYLAERDLDDLSERTISVDSATAFIGDTNEQVELAFDPPLLGRFSRVDGSDYEGHINLNSDEGFAIVDPYWDFVSDDPRLASYRSAWTYGTSYRADGSVEAAAAKPTAPEATEEPERPPRP